MVICLLTARLLAGVYKVTWRYSYAANYLMLILADTAGGILFLIIERLILGRIAKNINIPVSLMIIMASLSLISSMGIRLIYQIFYIGLYEGKNNGIHKNIENGDGSHNGGEIVKAAIIGAGRKAYVLADMLRDSVCPQYDVCGFFDSDLNLGGNILRGIKIYKLDDKTPELLANMAVDEIIIAIEPLNVETKEKLFDMFGKLGARIRIYDSPFNSEDKKNGKNVKNQIRDMHIEDLLFRDQIVIDDERISDYYKDKTILITGAGGSIGSELCRQTAKLDPARLVLLDIYENGVYDIQQELIILYHGDISVNVEIASVCDAEKLDKIFGMYKPDIVFHAAAHKHVPLMEGCCDEAVKNNVFGTLNMVNAAEKHNVSKFITISTDKAVNPTNVMGATKRLCEMIIQSKKNSATDFMAVRFGNVLGSNGSVIPLFQRQIENGGPVTITDKRIIRYFMTIPEASQLVMEAGVHASKGEIYVLDMGKPVKIITLAENMIKLAGLRPYVDIKIKEIGLRPGEKLYEELLMNSDRLRKTENDLIFIETGEEISLEEMNHKLYILNEALKSGNDGIREAIRTVVPTYNDPESVNNNAAAAAEMKSVYAVK